MARTASITYGQVAQIADQMKAAGTRPSARSVRERLGTGSMGTIHRFLQQWAGAIPAEENETPELPQSIAQTLMEFLSTEVATACEPLNEQVRDAQEAAAALAEENTRLESIIERLQQERDEAENGKATLTGTLTAVEQALTECRAELIKARTENSELKRRLELQDAKLAELAALPEKLAEKEKALTDSLSAYTEADKRAAVLEAKLEAAQARAQNAENRAASLESQSTQQQAELRNATLQVQACQARLEAAAREVEEARKELTAARMETKKARDEAAELRGQLKAKTSSAPKKPAKEAPEKV